MMELLSPAGSREALERAVAAGADAVYLGAAAFSARAGAGNFDDPALAEAVAFCHFHGVRVHVAVNTLVKDPELPEVEALLRRLAKLRVDAILVQDLGILQLLRQTLPGLTVHASTQMTLHNAAGVRWAVREGMRRVVLARECSLREIRLAAQEGAEIEVFGHGAQCVSVSGQCLYSSLVGGRSGNRGRCAQPCRLPCRLNGEEGAWLSPRDVCLRDHLRALEEASAVSVKLEGRLKRPEYVAVVTAAYRRGLDAPDIPASKEERRELLQIFQRGGFMDGYAMGCEDAAVIDPVHVNHGGVPLGKVERVGGPFASLRCTEALHDGDSLRVGRDYETVYSGPEVPAGGLAQLRLRPGDSAGLRTGDPVARLQDAEQLWEAMALPLPQIPVDLTLEAWPGKPLMLTASDGVSSVRCEGASVEPAAQRPLDAERARQQLQKTGGTGFVLRDCTVRTAGAFVPASALNELRREALTRLAEARREHFAPPRSPEYPARPVVLPASDQPLTVIFRDPAELGSLPEGARPVFFPEDWREPALREAIDRLDRPVWLQLPTVCEEATLENIRRLTAELRDRLAGVVLGSVGQLGIDWLLPFAAGSGIPVMNRRAAQFLLDSGCVFVTASCELNSQELRVLMEGRPPVLVPAFGRTQLMLLTHCPARARLGLRQGHAACALCDRDDSASLRRTSFTDRRGEAYPLQHVRLPEGCRVRLLNHLPTDLREEIAREGWPQLWELTDPPGVPGTHGHWRRGVE